VSRRTTVAAPVGSALITFLLIVAGIAYWAAGSFYNERSEDCTITGKDRGASTDGSSLYRIYTADCGVLADQDAWLRAKFDSADVFNQLQPGQRARLDVVGFRFPLTSRMPNILRVDTIPTTPVMTAGH
jgi:hypothetical protein